ncbi:protein translocase subunit SecF [Wolinella succinogenes]|uniref:protein translocase subunit SecF n=1 Tax=Wolinella succinogenes TaxID=844 RepID=UPI00240A78A9|nr:protein translocase subunit SecF [Wolinella succinogenes]
MELFKNDKVYDFVAWGRYTSLLSLLLLALSLGLFFTKGISYGIDFTGGSVVQVQYKEAAPLGKIREALAGNEIFKGAQVSEFGSKEEALIKVPASTSSVARDIGDIAAEALQGTGSFEVRRVDMVGPKVGDELRTKGTLALVLASIGMLLYVAFRYEWRFAIAAVLALMHDVIIAVGAIVLFEVDFGLDVVAALLTLIGYSINDTIIIFDRIRERLQGSKLDTLKEVMNEAVSRTLSRTILTSLTVFFVVFTLYAFGGEIIRGFSLPMLVGVIVGSYSSVFIAMQIVIWLGFDLQGYYQKLSDEAKKKAEKERMRSMYEKGVV